MAHTEEPEIKERPPEEKFRKHVKDEVEKILENMKSKELLAEYFILEKFGLDLAVFVKWPDNRFSICFFETKAFVGSRPDGVGFGNQKGKGSQVDLLLLKEEHLMLANQFIRWVFVDGTRPKGTRRFAIFDNIQAKNAAMGGVARGKQNNLRVSAIMKNAITWDALSKELEKFLMP